MVPGIPRSNGPARRLRTKLMDEIKDERAMLRQKFFFF